MDLGNLSEFVNIVIMGICLCVGYIVKNTIPGEKINRFIPLIAGGLGLILAIVSNLDNLSLNIILTGLVSGLASTGVYEVYKNSKNKEE